MTKLKFFLSVLFFCFYYYTPIFHIASQAQTIDSMQWARKKIFAAPLETLVPANSQSVKFIDGTIKPVIEVLINSKGPFRMLVDVGANVTLLQKKLVGELQLKNLRPEGGKLLIVDSIRIGSAKFSGIVAGESEWQENIDGVIGFNLFSECLLSFNYPNRILTVSTGELSKPDNNAIFEYATHFGLPYYNLKIGKDTLEVLLDTGMSGYFAVNSKLKDNHKFDLHKTTVSTTSSYYKGKATQTLLRDEIKIGKYAFHSCPTVISEEEGNRIGSGMFQYFVLTFDQKINPLLLYLIKIHLNFLNLKNWISSMLPSVFLQNPACGGTIKFLINHYHQV